MYGIARPQKQSLSSIESTGELEADQSGQGIVSHASSFGEDSSITYHAHHGTIITQSRDALTR